MRYYKIVISPPSGSGSTGFAPITYSTLNSTGGTNGSALQVDLDLFQTWYHQPAQNGFVRISGVDFKQIRQTANLNPSGTNYCSIQIYVGMAKGLPYANPNQAGLIINGSILQAFGNWQGNQTSLDLIVIPSTYVPDTSINLTCNWLKSENLQQAITNTLNTAYPGIPVNGTISSDLLYTEDQVGQYANLYAFSEYVNQVSRQIKPKDNYLGVSIASTSSGFLLFDGTQPTAKTIKINFQDIVGNITWIDTFTIQAKLVMRADMDVGTLVQFPTGIPFINTAGSYSQFRTNISFNGIFSINSVRHVGNSRQPDGNSWVTIIECVIPGATL
jgi:hypothetical protein